MVNLPPRLLPLLAAGLLVALVACSIGWRVWRGKPVLRPELPAAIFLATWRAGGSARASLGWQGRGILWIAVVRGELRVGPHFPFNLAFLPEALHLDFRIPGHRITSIEETAPGARLRVRFEHATGATDWVDIAPGDVAALSRSLAEIRAAPTRAP